MSEKESAVEVVEIADFAAMGDEAARFFLIAMCDIAHLWDDLIDRDREPSDSVINGSFMDMLVNIPSNEFYRRHQGYLHPVIVNAIINWRAAIYMERSHHSPRRVLECSYIIRSSYCDLFSAVAYIVGGIEHAVEAARKVREACHLEGYSVYFENLRLEQEGGIVRGDR